MKFKLDENVDFRVIPRLKLAGHIEDWYAQIDTLIKGLNNSEVIGKLWIIREGVIKEYQSLDLET